MPNWKMLMLLWSIKL